MATSRGLVVATHAGLVRGTLKGEIREFLGIPYAAPPLGELRWQPAQEHARWRGVLDATRVGSPCPQVEGLFAAASTNEDCLFLNVYTPLRDDYPLRLACRSSDPSLTLTAREWERRAFRLHGGCRKEKQRQIDGVSALRQPQPTGPGVLTRPTYRRAFHAGSWERVYSISSAPRTASTLEHVPSC